MIVGAAVYINGKTYIARRHYICVEMAFHDGAHLVSQRQQGFFTDDGKFVNRSLAAAIAYDARQIKKPKNLLYSEDLWP